MALAAPGERAQLPQLAPIVLGSPLPPASPAFPAAPGGSGAAPPKAGRGFPSTECAAGADPRLTPRQGSPARPVPSPTSPWELCPGVDGDRSWIPRLPAMATMPCRVPPGPDPTPGRLQHLRALPHRCRPRSRRHSPASHGAHPRPGEPRSSTAPSAPQQGGIRAVPPNPALPSGPELCRLSKGLIFPGFKPSPAVSELRALSLALFF